MSQKKFALYIPFNMFATPGSKELTAKWIRERLSIFMKYTRSSIGQLHTTPFMAYILYHPSCENLINNLLSNYPISSNNIKFIPSNSYETEITNYIFYSEYFY